MTRAQLERLVRRELETLPAELQEVALVRATGARIIAWSALSTAALYRVYGATRAVALIAS